jgi:hypothetical protein
MRGKNPLVRLRLPETGPTCDGCTTWSFVVNVEDSGCPLLGLSGLVRRRTLVRTHLIGEPAAREATVAGHG